MTARSRSAGKTLRRPLARRAAAPRVTGNGGKGPATRRRCRAASRCSGAHAAAGGATLTTLADVVAASPAHQLLATLEQAARRSPRQRQWRRRACVSRGRAFLSHRNLVAQTLPRSSD
jgi:hypothetical protein